MRMTDEQELAAAIVAQFGQPLIEPYTEATLADWAHVVGEFIEANPAPEPIHGGLYDVAGLGECRAVGQKPGHDSRIWVFERQGEPGRATPQPQYVAVALDTNLWEMI